MAVSLPRVFARIVSSYDPGRLVQEHLHDHPIAGDSLTVLALGKAAIAMRNGASAALGTRVAAEVVVAPTIPRGSPSGWFASTHPTPSVRSERAAKALLAAARQSDGPVLVLISGGGSALAALPAAGLDLCAKAALLSDVYAAGADIEELNTVRKHLSAFKGGRLAEASSHPVRTLVLSDVLGDCLSTVASGPTVPDASSYADALQIVNRRCGMEAAGAAVEHLRLGAAGLREETPKQARLGDEAILLAGIRSFLRFAEQQACEMGATAVAMPDLLANSVEQVAGQLAAKIRTANARPAVWIFGGEATIVLPPAPGTGGRAQHLALLLAEKIAGEEGLQILVVGSDGVDGNSLAAGALVDGSTWSSIREAGIAPDAALLACDSGRALGAIGAQIVTGPTGVNHADLVFVQFS